MGKKTKKPGKGKEKTEKKTAKADEKRARRESKKVAPEDDIEAILLSIQKEDAKKKEVHIEKNIPAPSPRSNCSLVINPLKETELILYGGEYYNGSKTFVYGDLYRYDIEKNEWKFISSPNSPPPRSAHQAVVWKSSLYIYGGEFTSPNQERFHHYKDFWVLDLKTNQWEQLDYKGCPSPRSGHRMVLYKHKIIIFGGFYDTLREVRYFNDMHVFDLDQFKWQEIKCRPGCLWPSPRSGFQFFVHQDGIFLYGGYSKEASSVDKASEKGVVRSDMWRLDPTSWEWNKVKKCGMPPGTRAGFSMCVTKGRAVLFGGVVDMEMEGDLMMSLFLNELYGFQLDNCRWYPLELRKEKGTKKKLKRDSERGATSMDSDKNVEAADRQNTEFSDGDDDSDYDVHAEKLSMNLKKKVEISESDGASRCDNKFGMPNSVLPEVVKPCGRINSCMVAGKDELYLYGGMLEVKDREVTLDDLYSLNLSKLDEWKCIIPASETEWLEPSDDESEGEREGEEEDNDSEESSGEYESEEESGRQGNGLEAQNGTASLRQMGSVAIIRGDKKNLRRKEKQARVEQIRVSLGLSDSQRTPVPGESLRDFYKRTSSYWHTAAYEHTQHTGKELRKDGFDLAKARYRELKPILDELAILEAEQKAEEEATAPDGGKKKTRLLSAANRK